MVPVATRVLVAETPVKVMTQGILPVRTLCATTAVALPMAIQTTPTSTTSDRIHLMFKLDAVVVTRATLAVQPSRTLAVVPRMWAPLPVRAATADLAQEAHQVAVVRQAQRLRLPAHQAKARSLVHQAVVQAVVAVHQAVVVAADRQAAVEAVHVNSRHSI